MQNHQQYCKVIEQQFNFLNMINLRDIIKSNYTSCYKIHREEELDEKRKIFGEKELNTGLSKIVCGVPDAIEDTIKYFNSLDQFIL